MKNTRTGLLLRLARTVFERAHTGQNLRKSFEFVRILKLCNSDALFPDQTLVGERLDFILDVVESSPQRPVVSCAALIGLDLEFEHGWSAQSQEHRSRLLNLAQTASNPVMPLIALESKILGQSTASSRLTGQTLIERRLRLEELIEVVDTHEAGRSLDTLVNETFEALFEGTNDVDKSKLVHRLMECLSGRKSMKRCRVDAHDRPTTPSK